MKVKGVLLNGTERTFSNGFSIQLLPAENVRMLGMSGIFLYHFPPCLNPNGPQDVLASALDCPWPKVLWEG